MLGDWATGSKLKALRAITEFDPNTGQPIASHYECEVYSPNGNLVSASPRSFVYTPPDATTAAAVAQIVQGGLVAIQQAEGLDQWP